MNNFEVINAQVPITEVIQQDVDLKRSGNILRACCPFHDERTPSFSVYPEQNRFHCFGCEATGDVIDYVMKINHFASTTDAMEEIAHKYNIHLENIDHDAIHHKKEIIQRNRQSFAAQYKQADKAAEYLKERGFTDEDLIKRTFSLGYDEKEHAVVIPFFNEYGELVGRTYRYLSDNAQPKYKNSAEDEVFKKSDLLFGLDKARKDKQDRLFLVEGYFDCMAMYQLGIGQTAAYASAHITERQGKLLNRHTDKKTHLYLIPDNDDAGRKAITKNVQNLRKSVANPISVMTLPANMKDVNDLLLAGGGLEQLKSEPAESYLMKEELQHCLEITDEFEVAREWSKRTTNPVLRYDMAQYLAERWQKPEEVVNEFMRGKGNIDYDQDMFTATEAYTAYVDREQSPEPALHFGMRGLDNAIDGINKQEVVFLMGKAGSAKTTFILNWMYRMIFNQEFNILFSSLEMAKESIIPQFIQIHKNEPMHHVQTMAREGSSDEKVAELLETLDQRMRIVDKDSQSLEEIESYVHAANDSFPDKPIQAVFIDYFQYLKVNSRVSRYEAMSEAARELKAMAKRLDVTVICLTQVNREKSGGGFGKLSLESAKETGGIEESGDYVLALSRPGADPDMDADEKLERQHEMLCQVLKARFAQLQDVDLWFDGMTKRIEDGEGRF